MKEMMRRVVLVLLLGLLLPVGSALGQQQGVIQGRVVDADGQPVENAVVSVLGGSDARGITGEEGRFFVDAQVGQRVKVEAPGYVTRIATVDENGLTITLGAGDRAVPIGYGVVRSRDGLTAAVGQVGADELTERSVINPANALYGRIPGLMVLQNGGILPNAPTMFIRGRATLGGTGASAPLILVDGFQRPFRSVELEAIADVTVLKDAAALAKYGQRGANGVVLITTKRGKRGGLAVNVSYEMGMTRPIGLPNFVEAPYYAQAVNEARINDGLDPRYSPVELQAFKSGAQPYFYPNVNWFDQVLRDHGVYTNFNVNLRGGDARIRYFASINYLNQSGLFGPVNRNAGFSTQVNYRQADLRTQFDIEITDNLLLQADLTATIRENNRPSGGNGAEQIFDVLYTLPSAAFPVKTPAGEWGGTQRYNRNPMAMLTDTGFGQPNSREFSLTGRLRQDLSSWLNGLSATVALSYYSYGSFFENKSRNFRYAALSPVRNQEGNIVDTTVTYYGEDTDLEFDSSFGDKTQNTDIVGKLNYSQAWESTTLDAMVLFHQSSQTYSGVDNVYHRRRFVGNVHVGLAGKYFFGATLAYSGHNNLPAGEKYGLFPALSAAWLLSEEGFLQGVDVLDRLKLQASVGMTGSARIPTANLWKPNYNYGLPGYWYQDSYNDVGGFGEGRLTTADFTYETAYMGNIGVEAALLDRLELSANLFYERRTDILTFSGGDVSEVIGILPALETNGIVENRGIEAAVSWTDAIGAVGYHIGGQFTYAQNKIVEMNEQFRPYDYLRRTGRSVGQQFGLVVIGFFDDQEEIANSPRQVFGEVQPGDLRYKDQNGDGVINQYDAVPLGYSTGYPGMYFSATLGVSYKGLSVSALFQGTGRYTGFLGTRSIFRPIEQNNTISTYYYNRRWTPETAETATLPRLTTQANPNNYRLNSLWLVDRSYIKLRTLEVSYTLPESLIQNLRMDEMQIYVRGKNLFSVDEVPVVDPERMVAGYPLMRSYIVGLEFSF